MLLNEEFNKKFVQFSKYIHIIVKRDIYMGIKMCATEFSTFFVVENFENGTYHVLPRIVLEVTADLVSTNAEGNYGLRFPRLVAIRDDKAVREIDTFDDLLRMVE